MYCARREVTGVWWCGGKACKWVAIKGNEWWMMVCSHRSAQRKHPSNSNYIFTFALLSVCVSAPDVTSASHKSNSHQLLTINLSEKMTLELCLIYSYISWLVSSLTFSVFYFDFLVLILCTVACFICVFFLPTPAEAKRIVIKLSWTQTYIFMHIHPHCVYFCSHLQKKKKIKIQSLYCLPVSSTRTQHSDIPFTFQSYPF